MSLFFLKFHILGLLIFLLSSVVSAQNLKFIYIQSDNKQPFYVKVDDKLLNSSEGGYLIISRLLAGTYSIKIGFTENESQEMNLSVKVSESNIGFLLKNGGDKGWTMTNLQTMQPVVIKKQVVSVKGDEGFSSGDEFAKILAEVVNEPSISWRQPIKSSDSIPNVVSSTIKTEKKKNVIPLKTKIDENPVKKEGLIITEKKLTINKDTVGKGKAAVLPIGKAMINSNCKKTATQNDFLKLRKQMAGEANEKNMIRAANKQFLITCFTSDQIKNLGILFINDEEKYKFFVAAFSYVSDSDNYKILADELTDIYYKTRFNAMLNH